MSYNFIPEDDYLYYYNSKPHVLLQKEFVKYIRGYQDNDQQEQLPDVQKSYPLVNSYYEFAEDYDAVNRVPHLLYEQNAHKTSFENPSMISDDSLDFSFELESSTTELVQPKIAIDQFVERKAQNVYLETKPKCFVILGKPGLGEERLGKLLADYWKCVFIHPEALIQDEIASGSRAGLCIEFNLRCGRSISIDVIMRLLGKCLNSDIVKHRGFVLCGFPLIPNNLLSDDPVSSESAIFNVHEIFEEILDSVVSKDTVKNVSPTSTLIDLIEEEEQEQEEVEDETLSESQRPKVPDNSTVLLDTDSDKTNKPICFQSQFYTMDSNQMEYIMSLCEDHDYIIIYLKCHSEEVVNIRQDNRYDCQSFKVLNLQRERSDNSLYSIYSVQPTIEEIIPENDEVISQQKLVKLQNEFPAHVRAQLEKYLLETQLVIEKHILLKNTQDIIKLDGRMSPHRLFQVLRMRLKVLPLLPVILPKLLITPNVDFEEPGEGPEKPRNVDIKYEDIAPEEAFEDLCIRKTLGALYKWNLSEWKYNCPVAMKKGQIVVGETKYAVHFMNKLFFFSNEKRCEKFLRNPRPFLLPPMPLTMRRVYVIGPEHSGKTPISQCIQHFLRGKVIDFNVALAEYRNKALKRSMNSTIAEALRRAMDNMKEMRKKAYFDQEAERLRKLNKYIECIKQTLQEIYESLIIIAEYPYVEFSAFPAPSQMEKTPSIVKAEAIIDKYTAFAELFEIEIPEDCEKYLNDEALIIQRLPIEMQEPIVFTYAVVSTESKYVKNIVQEAIHQLEMDCVSKNPSPEFLAKFINSLIKAHNELIARNKITGWIIDGFPASPGVFDLIDNLNRPDIVYMITDSSNGKYLLNIAKHSLNTEGKSIQSNYADSELSELVPCTVELNTVSMITDISDMKNNEEINELDNCIQDYLVNIEPVIQDKFKEYKILYEEIDVGGIPFKNVLVNLIDSFRALYSPIAEIVTDEEKQQEPYNYGDGDGLESDEEIEGEGGDHSEDPNMNFKENRRLGNTADYDPVAFYLYNVLWQGKEDFLVKYMNKMWLFGTNVTMDAFVESPHTYSKHKLYNVKLPPTRICIVGNRNIGKTTQARLLSKRLGLYYLDFEKELAKLSNRTGEGYVDAEAESQQSEEGELHDGILKEILLPFWHDPSKKIIGFILDGFPRRPNDIQFMTNNFLIPDCVVELYMDIYDLNARLLNILLDEWRNQIEMEKAIYKANFDIELDAWRLKRNDDKALLMEERRRIRFSQQHDEEEEMSENESLMSYLSYQEATDEKEVDALLDEEYPEPVLYDNWETEENATERLQEAVERTTAVEPIFLSEMKMRCEDERIPWHIIDSGNDITQVYNGIMQRVMKYIFRNNSLFERSYNVSIEMAEKLFEDGYYFPSRFGRTCPVQMYEYSNPLQMYIQKESKFEIFPLIYSNYIYFLAGVENRDKFKQDILKYVTQPYIPLPLFRTRIAAIGPPRCGKTTISERMASEFALEHISIGKAIRRVLNSMPSSILAQRVRNFVQEGKEVPNELVTQCVEAMTFEARAVAMGYITDGFPNNIDEMKLLAQMNLLPHVIFDLEASLNYILEYMDVFEPSYKPEYPKSFVKYRYDNWQIDKEVFRTWAEREYQNIITVAVDPSKWKTWTTVKKTMLSVFKEIKEYYRHINKDIPLRVAHMLVTPYEFYSNQTDFKQYCHWCLCRENVLNSGGKPPDSSGLLNYRGKFYWLCQEHIKGFEENPETYLGTNCMNTLPSSLPEPMILSEMPANVYFKGYCIVCLARSKLDKTLNMGSLNYTISYADLVYLFDTRGCMREFEKGPQSFQDTLPYSTDSILATLDNESLPTMGFLEQFCANQITKALIEIETVRPLIPGLNISQSAIVSLGLILKINNPNTPEKYLELYKTAKKNSMTAQEEIRRQISDAKKTINPYLHYQEPLPPFKMNFQILHKESTDSMYIREIINGMLDQIDYDETKVYLEYEMNLLGDG